jgi:hypothetical protein
VKSWSLLVYATDVPLGIVGRFSHITSSPHNGAGQRFEFCNSAPGDELPDSDNPITRNIVVDLLLQAGLTVYFDWNYVEHGK